MTCYLTDDTDPDDVERGFREGIFTGREALSRQRHDQLRRRRHRLPQDRARARAHGKDRHAAAHPLRGSRSHGRRVRSRGRVHRPAPHSDDEEVSRPEDRPRTHLLEDRRRLRAQRRAAGRRQRHALSHAAQPHRLARLGQPSVHVLHAGHQDRAGPARASARRRHPARRASSSAPIPRPIPSRASSPSSARRASSIRPSASKPTRRSSRRTASSKTSRRSRRSTGRSITACSRTPTRSRSRRRRGRRPRRSCSTGRRNAR